MKYFYLHFIVFLFLSCSQPQGNQNHFELKDEKDCNKLNDYLLGLIKNPIDDRSGDTILLGFELGSDYKKVFNKMSELEKQKMIDITEFMHLGMGRSAVVGLGIDQCFSDENLHIYYYYQTPFKDSINSEIYLKCDHLGNLYKLYAHITDPDKYILIKDLYESKYGPVHFSTESFMGTDYCYSEILGGNLNTKNQCGWIFGNKIIEIINYENSENSPYISPSNTLVVYRNFVLEKNYVEFARRERENNFEKKKKKAVEDL